MLQLKSHLFNGSMPRLIRSAVIAIGGAEDRVRSRQILHAFFNRAGSTNARIVIIPSASREPEIMGRRYQDIFQDMGAKQVEVLTIRDREQAESALLQAYLEDCTGVFLSGGDQLRLCGLLAETPFVEKLRLQVRQGQTTLAGTSAGAAVIGHQMIAGGGSGESPSRSLVDLTVGFGIIPKVIVDQHFYNRNRIARLISAIAAHPDKLGIGIDEDTSAVFEADGLIRVIGSGTVTIVDPIRMTYTNQPYVEIDDPISIHNLRLHILSHGDRFDLKKHRVLLPVQAEELLG